MADLQAIIDQLVVIENGITPPAGEKAITAFSEPPPEAGLVFPCFINVEVGTEEIGYGTGLRITPYLIDLHLVFETADQRYSRRSARTWSQQVLNAFAGKLTLNNAATEARILTMEFGLLNLDADYPATDYLGVTFRLRTTVKEPVAFGV